LIFSDLWPSFEINSLLFFILFQIQRTLKHNNLLLFIGACDETGTAFLVTEFAKHGSLDRVLEVCSEATSERIH
jgi:hypothetical protein